MHTENKHEHTHLHHFGQDIHCSCSHCCHEEHEHHHHEHEHEHEHHHDHEESPVKKIILSAILLSAAMILEHFSSFGSSIIIFDNVSLKTFLPLVLYFCAYILVAKDVVRNAISNIRKGEIFDEQFLMTAASLGALFVKQVPEAVAVMLFYQLGEFFEDFAVDKSKDSISSLMELCPDKAFVIKDGEVISVRPEEVKAGDRLLVKPGERIPVDGTVAKGKSFIDNSALTGESVPVEVFEGNGVYSGAINKTSAIEIICLRPAEDSAASRILKLVDQSNEKKARTEKFIKRFSKVYTPVVCLAALLVAVLPPVINGMAHGNWEWQTWIYRALMFLVVSCPCALVISVPLTFFGGLGSCSKKGILVKGSSSLEALAKMKTAVFDKTGTLTKGSFLVTEIHPVNPEKIPEDELVALAAHAETYSNHPAAVSLKSAHHHDSKCTISNISDAEEISGQGIKAVVDGKTVLAGNASLMTSQNVRNFIPQETQTAGTTVHLAIDGEYCGSIVISDETKNDSKTAVQKLRKLGISRIVMLTGDNTASAGKTAQEIGISEFYAELLPENKVQKVEKLLEELEAGGKKKGTLAFIGDGINDAPVLARSDVGIAMGALGSDAAIESADVVIMTDEPAKISEAVKTSRKTISIVYQNIIFSLGVKVLIMILSGMGITNIWTAVFGDVGVSLIAILNAVRALK